MVVELEDFHRALSWLNKLEPNMPEAFGGHGDNPYASAEHEIEKFIRTHKVVTFGDIVSAFWRLTTRKNMIMIIGDLKLRGLVVADDDKEGNPVIRWIE
jgi:hypothetical protein